jgi:predicted nucleotidyltransferase
MMNISLRDKDDQIGLLAARYGAKNIRILGSRDADVDVVVQMGPGRTFLDLIGLWHSLEDLLGAKVDIIDEPRI